MTKPEVKASHSEPPFNFILDGQGKKCCYLVPQIIFPSIGTICKQHHQPKAICGTYYFTEYFSIPYDWETMPRWYVDKDLIFILSYGLSSN